MLGAYGDITVWEMALRLTIAALLGTTLGFDRESRHKPAGMRTFAMVSLGAAMFTLIALHILEQWSAQPHVRLDLIRLIGGIAGGIGFLGAGVIIQAQGDIKGITTAASIWMIAAVGVACGAGAYLLAMTGVALSYMVLVVLAILKKQINTLPDKHEKNR